MSIESPQEITPQENHKKPSAIRRGLGKAARIAAVAAAGFGVFEGAKAVGGEIEKERVSVETLAQTDENDPRFENSAKYLEYVHAKLLTIRDIDPEKRLTELEKIAQNFLKHYSDLVEDIKTQTFTVKTIKYSKTEDLREIGSTASDILFFGKTRELGEVRNRQGSPVFDELVTFTKNIRAAVMH